MPIILFFLSLPAFAQLLCDPKEAQMLCYNQLCSAKKIQPIPVNPAKLEKAVAAHTYKLPVQADSDLKQIDKVLQAVKTRAQKPLISGELSKIADELIEEPEEGMSILDGLFSGELQCTNKDIPCDLLSSNLVSYTDRMKNVYKEFWEAMIFSKMANEFTPHEQKKHLVRMLKITMSDKAEEKKINALTDVQISDYVLSASWMAEYKKKMKARLKVFKKDLQDILKIKIQNLMTMDFNNDEFRTKIERQCQLASFLEEKLSSPDVENKFHEMRDETLKNFKSKFLTRLSRDTAKNLSEKANSDLFELQKIQI